MGLKERQPEQSSGNAASFGGTDYNYGARDFGDTPEKPEKEGNSAGTEQKVDSVNPRQMSSE